MVQIKKKIADIWEYKVANIGNIVNFVLLWKRRFLDSIKHDCIRMHKPVSDGSRISPRGGREPSKGGGREHTILPNSPKNCMKLKEFGCRGGACIPHAPLRSATGSDGQLWVQFIWRQLYFLKTPPCSFCTRMSNLYYLWKAGINIFLCHSCFNECDNFVLTLHVSTTCNKLKKRIQNLSRQFFKHSYYFSWQVIIYDVINSSASYNPLFRYYEQKGRTMLA